MRCSFFERIIGIVLTALLCFTVTACGSADSGDNVGANTVSSNISNPNERFDGYPMAPQTPEELMKPSTHIMFAMCAGVYMDDKDPEQVLFYFLPIKCVLGELEEVPLGTNLAYYGHEAILVKGDVNDYQLDNVYAEGNTYELYLKENKNDNGEVYYTDLLPYSEVLKFEEVHEFCYDESYVSELKIEMDDRTADIMKLIDRIENVRK